MKKSLKMVRNEMLKFENMSCLRWYWEWFSSPCVLVESENACMCHEYLKSILTSTQSNLSCCHFTNFTYCSLFFISGTNPRIYTRKCVKVNIFWRFTPIWSCEKCFWEEAFQEWHVVASGCGFWKFLVLNHCFCRLQCIWALEYFVLSKTTYELQRMQSLRIRNFDEGWSKKDKILSRQTFDFELQKIHCANQIQAKCIVHYVHQLLVLI